MGTGRRLGLGLAGWLASGTAGLANGTALGNRLSDLLGADQSLAGPLRDLARRPLLHQALNSSGLARRTALQALVADLKHTYAPAVLGELVELLEAALGEPGLDEPGLDEARLDEARPGEARPRETGLGEAAPGETDAPAATLEAAKPIVVNRRQGLQEGNIQPLLPALAAGLVPLGPGLALGAAMALVLSWLAGVLERQFFHPWHWSGGIALVTVLALLQIGTAGRQGRLRKALRLNQRQSGDPRRAWRWVTAPWIHASNGEALLHALVLLLILGPSPLPLEDGVLRFALTALATMALGALAAKRLGLRHQHWAGASGVSGALIGLPTALSLLRWREISFPLGSLAVPAWVLLVVVGSLQLAWILPLRGNAHTSRARDRLLVSQWWWGLVLGVGWASLTWLWALLGIWLRASR
jgi:hypothetical protein